MNTFNLTLDLNKSRASSPVRLRQGDKSGTTISALILDHGATANLTGMTAQLVMELPDGTQYYRKSASVSGNVVTVVVDESTAASVSGRTANAYFQLLQGTTVKASTGSFVVEILPDALEGHTVPESYDSAIQDAIDALDAAVEQMPDMVEDVLADHPEWTTTVQDGSITKAKLATDLARDRERLLYRLANMLTNTLPEGDVATATDAAQTPVAGLALYGRSTQDGTPTPSAPVAIQSVQGNLLDPVQIFGGASYYTVNADGSVTVTAEDSRGWASVPSLALAAGTYAATIDGNAGGRVICHVYVGGVDTPWEIIGNGSKTFTLAADGEVKLKVHQGTFPRTVRIALYRGSTVYPYVPYGHAGLWARGRNLFTTNANRTVSGITFTSTEDGGVSLSGTSTAQWPSFTTDIPITDFAGRMLAVSAGGVSGETYVSFRQYDERLQQVADTATVDIAGWSSTTPKTFVVADETAYIHVVIGVRNSGTTVNTTVTPQIEVGSTAHAYEPYTYTVTPIDLDGHELRSLPDGTRDKVTVDARGHAVLVQRVGSYTVTGSEQYVGAASVGTCYRVALVALSAAPAAAGQRVYGYCTHAPYDSVSWTGDRVHAYADGNNVALFAVGSSVSDVLNAYRGAEITYHLATPVTIDLGYVDAVPLVGPDLTAQAIPTAPMQLTYERDLNATLARLESAIATLA